MFISAFVWLLFVGISFQQFGRHHHQPLRQGKMTEWVNVMVIIFKMGIIKIILFVNIVIMIIINIVVIIVIVVIFVAIVIIIIMALDINLKLMLCRQEMQLVHEQMNGIPGVRHHHHHHHHHHCRNHWSFHFHCFDKWAGREISPQDKYCFCV